MIDKIQNDQEVSQVKNQIPQGDNDSVRLLLLTIEQIEAELKAKRPPAVLDLSHLFNNLVQYALNASPEAAQKIEAIAEMFPSESFHSPKNVDLQQAKELVKESKELLGEDHVVPNALEKFIELFEKSREQPPNVQQSILDLTKRFETERSQKAMSNAQNKLAEIEKRVLDLQSILDAMQSDDPKVTTFDISELSNEWAKLTQLLKEIPPGASLYVREQAKKLLTLMETCDITGPLDEKTCKKLTTEVQRLLEGSQKEYPEVTRALELTMHLVTMFQKMVDFMAREDRHGRRTFAQNCKV
ncbi:MAG: hypothetical protein ChlgKO_10080 [Chlamydiales bacterium]